jgi:hypothetical protein
LGRRGKELNLRFIGEAGERTYTQIYWGSRGKNLYSDLLGRRGKELTLRFIGEAGERTYTQIYCGGWGNNLYSDLLGGDSLHLFLAQFFLFLFEFI